MNTNYNSIEVSEKFISSRTIYEKFIGNKYGEILIELIVGFFGN